jgi:hypothetical protein
MQKIAKTRTFLGVGKISDVPGVEYDDEQTNDNQIKFGKPS